MSGIGTGYDLSVTTYSPDGKVFQTEYAQKAVDSGNTVIGLRCKDGVVLAVEKPVMSKLYVEDSSRRIFNVDKHIGAVVAGLVPDGRVLVARALEEASSYKRFYGEPIPSQVLSDRLAHYAHLFNLYWSYRPFGNVILLAAYDEGKEPSLYSVDPAGNCLKFFGTAVGKARQAAKNEIEKLKLTEMTCREAVIEAVKILHKIQDEDNTRPFQVEVSWICEETGRIHKRIPDELKEEAERAAKAALEDSDMDD
uniref:Proteasome subunit alpha type-3 n=1 Tax=Polytomella parva TaxID=51329 RepID=A0A7S0YIX0_9CHLO|mmetsp:Transcript_29068/g.53421  ORF Transcript_29068/g.53421 Transcript_29068/m.53421 type:complete len:252 (+) Transcript_29068:200-955(+)|eukprot:CAMPEP_0175076902 /NCGR_PEP_ID=MMETSP0052_2-20121109/23037_1 /TAXON_ID=51329 ORGANISM="Polytomella parva, Strain SAG 63-3" /NCGR_SAMPLE_ID=MMETSP0052_2 /ASSEMBLY_ACC=CAM_ASM_000194 /LENGTH=251 /DNA_ID=CAMNT_0016346197 /DNA_START=175 /DNA_END=930 /DNA_ORIENTATION=+